MLGWEHFRRLGLGFDTLKNRHNGKGPGPYYRLLRAVSPTQILLEQESTQSPPSPRSPRAERL